MHPALRLVWIVLFGLMAFAPIRFTTAAQVTPLQSPELALQEAQTVYLGNLARRDNGLPPLRWNRQLTDAARWFSWDAGLGPQPSYCLPSQSPPDERRLYIGWPLAASGEGARTVSTVAFGT